MLKRKYQRSIMKDQLPVLITRNTILHSLLQWETSGVHFQQVPSEEVYRGQHWEGGVAAGALRGRRLTRYQTAVTGDKHTYIHTYVHTYIHTYIHMYTHTYIHTYIHMYTHTYIHIYTHRYNNMCSFLPIHYKQTYMYVHRCMQRELIYVPLFLAALVARLPSILP